MKIGIYNEPTGSGLGGSEFMVAVLAEALSNNHQVDIVHHKPSLSVQQISQHFNTNLRAVRLRYVAPEYDTLGYFRNPRERYRRARNWQDSLSRPYDLFINSTHGMPPFCQAPLGVLIVLFPTFNRFNLWPWSQDSSTNGLALLRHMKRFYYEWEWKKRFASYQLITVISQFTKEWTKHLWSIDGELIYAPVDTNFNKVDKVNAILSVGRFTTTGHSKKQLEMIKTFKNVKMHLPGWQYHCLGSLGDAPDDQMYFNNVCQEASGCGAEVHSNLSHNDLRNLYEKSKIFWHAAGYGDDEATHPELAEHFGIVTVEAMAAGCVPIVINKGGQSELVEHGTSGFLWNTLDELRDYTMMVANDNLLRLRMSEAAQMRAQDFSRESFVSRFMNLLQPMIS